MSLAAAVAAILEVGPLAGKYLQNHLRGNKARNLDRLVLAEFADDESVPQGLRDSLRDEWLEIHKDGRVAVVLAGLLGSGEPESHLQALEKRLGEVMVGLETLPAEPGEFVTRFVAAVRHNYVAAQQDAMEAIQRSHSGQNDRFDRLDEKLDASLEAIEQTAARPSSPRVIVLSAGLGAEIHRRIDALNEVDEAGAGRLAAELKVGGPDALVGLALVPPDWAQSASADFWRTVGRLLVSNRKFRAAQAAFELQANTPGADRAEALMAAARVAEADKRPTDAQAFYESAKLINPEHPSVALFAAAQLDDPGEALTAVEAVLVVSQDQVARKERMRAIYLLGQGRYEEAQRAAESSSAADPDAGGKELASVAVILGVREKPHDQGSDDRPLIEAVKYQWSLYEQLIGDNRLGMAGVAGARAAMGYAALGDTRNTERAFDAVIALGAEPLEPEAENLLLAAALAISDHGRAAPLVATIEDPVERVIVGAAVSLMADGDRTAIVASLDEVLVDLPPGDQRARAVATRLAAASQAGMAVDDELAAEVPDSKRLVAEFDAATAMAKGDLEAAALALAPFDDEIALAQRADIAEKAGNLAEALGLQRALVRKQPTAAATLRLARLRAKAGDYAGAVSDALKVASDERRGDEIRDSAYSLAGQAAVEASDWDELDQISQRWTQFRAASPDALFARVLALARLGRHQEAREYAETNNVEPTEQGNRYLLFAELCQFGYENKWEGLRALMELSERFGRPQDLELAFIAAVLAAPEDERGDDEDVIARFQDAMSNFEERFPDSGAIRAITVDDDDSPEQLIDKLATVQPRPTHEQQATLEEFIEGVRLGTIPVSFLAALAGRSTIDTIIRNGAHPLAIFDQDTHEAEVEAASQALDQAAATWDETACMTVAEISEAARKRIKAALPNSTVGQGVRESLVRAAHNRPAGKQAATMHVAPDGAVRIYEADEAMVARVRDAEDGAAAIAEEWAAHPDAQDRESGIAKLLLREEQPGPVRALASSIMAAEDLDASLYSDDRVTRALARSLNVRAFGTLALIDAMQRRGTLDEAVTISIVNEVVDLGIWGLLLTPASYVDAARRAGFAVARCWQALLGDEVVMRFEPRIAHNALLLDAVAGEAPEQLKDWSEVMVSTYETLFQIDRHTISSLLVAAQLDPDQLRDNDGASARVGAIAEALTSPDSEHQVPSDDDLLVSAFRRWLSAAHEDQRDQVLASLLSQIPVDERPRLQGLFEDQGDPGPE